MNDYLPGHEVRRLRELMGCTITELAIEAMVHDRLLDRFERGTYTFGDSAAARVNEAILCRFKRWNGKVYSPRNVFYGPRDWKKVREAE